MATTRRRSTGAEVEARRLRRIPNSYDSAPVILDLLADGRQLWNKELQALVADHFGLTKAEREWIRPGQEQQKRSYFSNETAWAMSRLKNPYGFITRPPTRMLYSITPSGRQAQRNGRLVADAEEKGVRAGKRVIAANPSRVGRPKKAKPASIGNGSAEIESCSVERHELRPLATTYSAVSESPRPQRDPFEYDPDELDRRTLEHAKLQNALAAEAWAAGFRVFQPGEGDPVSFDLAWTRSGKCAVVEIKTLRATGSEAKQLRLAIGQVLDYRHQLQEAGADVEAVIAVDRKPHSSHWARLSADHSITLVWPSTFRTLFAS